MKSAIKSNMLDCTLRDGGYYNNWDFSSKLVNDYLKVMSKVGIKYVEIGFRSFTSTTYKGSNWYTTDDYLESLKIPSSLKIVVMVNASQILNEKNILKATKLLFKPKIKSKVDIVRIACHFHEVQQSLKILKELKKLGYQVAINLMQISEQSDEKVLEISKKLSQTNLDILYFADSLGSMKINEIDRIIKNIKTFWKGQIGVHMHNNLGQALINNIYCLDEGIQWIDSTIMGMGRGAGNAFTEHFIIEYNKFYKKKLDIISLQNLISKKISDKGGFIKYRGTLTCNDTLLAQGEMLAFITEESTTNDTPKKLESIPEISIGEPIQFYKQIMETNNSLWKSQKPILVLSIKMI